MTETGNNPVAVAARIILDGELNAKVNSIARRHSGILCWTLNQSTPKEGMIDNGTICFVQTSRLRFLLTCSHVWQGYLRVKAKTPHVGLWVILNTYSGSLDTTALELGEPHLIGEDEKLDLATITFNSIESLEPWRFYDFRDQPNQRVKSGSPACFVAYTGEGLREGRQRKVLSYSVFTLFVSDSGQTRFVIHAREGSRPLFSKAGTKTDRIKLGGVSGAPVFTLDRTLTPLLAGVVSQVSSPGIQSSDAPYEMSDGDIYVTYADFVQSDGSIRSS